MSDQVNQSGDKVQPEGEPITMTDAQLETAAEIRPVDIAHAKQDARRVDPKLAALLNAKRVR